MEFNNAFPDAQIINKLDSKKHDQIVQMRLLRSKLMRIERASNKYTYGFSFIIELYKYLSKTTLLEIKNLRNATFLLASKTINRLQTVLENQNERNNFDRDTIKNFYSLIEYSKLIREKVMLQGIDESINNVTNLHPHNIYKTPLSLYITPTPPREKSLNDFDNISDDAKVIISDLSNNSKIVAVLEVERNSIPYGWNDIFPNFQNLFIISFVDNKYIYWLYEKFKKLSNYNKAYDWDANVYIFNNRLSPMGKDLIIQDEGLEEYATAILLLNFAYEFIGIIEIY